MSIRQSLIQQFMHTLPNQSSQQTITLLALIGIESVLQDNDNKLVREQITLIKRQIENIQTKEEEHTIRGVKSKERALTPKITESQAPTPLSHQRNAVSRHHLDDQAMRMALSQQYEETEQIRSPKSEISNIRTPKQSIQYFIEMKSQKSKRGPENKLKELQNNLTRELIADYQGVLEEIKQNPTKYTETPETSLQEQQIKDYIKLQQQVQLQQQKLEIEKQQQQLKQQSQDYNQSQKDLLNLKRRIETQPDYKLEKPWQVQEKKTNQGIVNQKQEPNQIQTQMATKKVQSTPQQKEKKSPNRYEQQQQQQSQQSVLQTENTFSFFQRQKTQGTQINTQQSINYEKHSGGLKQMADKLINSPIIQQVSLKSAENVSSPGKEVQVSQFEEQDSMSSNSSAFSLFQPNEELKSFFRKELIKEENDENHDPNCVKYSNIFLKGRMGGSKVF
ncbi:unnamed protein product [Paramecium octaurelia]|uniref:Uncharacterized protein n=1 Tax=Paramecium octaurelia TaxID=43137 RepID=A0A8S1W8V7_PAROT|nr:unnamed protein product [Paramecium octaurelia]